MESESSLFDQVDTPRRQQRPDTESASLFDQVDAPQRPDIEPSSTEPSSTELSSTELSSAELSSTSSAILDEAAIEPAARPELEQPTVELEPSKPSSSPDVSLTVGDQQWFDSEVEAPFEDEEEDLRLPLPGWYRVARALLMTPIGVALLLLGFTVVSSLVGEKLIDNRWSMASAGLIMLLVPLMAFSWLRRRFFRPNPLTVVAVFNLLVLVATGVVATQATHAAVSTRGSWWIEDVASLAGSQGAPVVTRSESLLRWLVDQLPGTGEPVGGGVDPSAEEADAGAEPAEPIKPAEPAEPDPAAKQLAELTELAAAAASESPSHAKQPAAEKTVGGAAAPPAASAEQAKEKTRQPADAAVEAIQALVALDLVEVKSSGAGPDRRLHVSVQLINNSPRPLHDLEVKVSLGSIEIARELPRADPQSRQLLRFEGQAHGATISQISATLTRARW